MASLFVFPCAIPWMIAAWLLGYTLLVLCGRQGYLCLIVAAAVTVGKRPTPAASLLGLLAVMAVIAALDVWRSRPPTPPAPRRAAWLCTLALWAAWGGMALDWNAAAHCRHPVALKTDRPIACYGDSMTSLGMLGGYPKNLQDLVSLPVVNLGIGGISAKSTADEHLLRLAQVNPQVVVIELGGHDFLNGESRASTKAALLKVIGTARQIGAEVVLVEVPRAFISDPYWGLEREIARLEDIELMSDTAMRRIFLRSTVFPPGTWLGEPYLTDESGIHPNEAGRQIFAAYVAAALERIYGPGIRKH